MKTCKNNYKLPGAFISWNQIKIGLKLALKKIFTIIKTKLLKIERFIGIPWKL